MAIVYKRSDKIKLNIGDIGFVVSPLSYSQKIDIMSCFTNQSGVTIEDLAKGTFKLVKYTVKEVIGLSDIEGKKYELSFENDILTDDCVDELLNIEQNEKLSIALQNFLRGVPTEIVDPNTGQKIEGVEVMPIKGSIEKK